MLQTGPSRDLVGGLLRNDAGRIVVEVLVGVAAALLVVAIVSIVVRQVARRRGWPDRSIARMRRPFRLLLVLIGAWIGLDTALFDMAALPVPTAVGIDLGFKVVVVAAGAWLASAVVFFLVDLGLGRYRTDVRDNRAARRARTQVLVLRRVSIAVIVVIGIAAILLSFPGASTAGTSLLASAGVVSVIAGVAAQQTLGNVVAGIQLAFSGAIRVDDVVIANGEWGRIEEITLTYVVVHIWDDRRMVLPSTYFTTTPFENWTRTGSELMQAVEFDLDWLVDPSAMREEMHRVLARTDLWDGRTAVLQVTDAVAGFVRVRILITAVDAPTLFDLRCFVREELVRWLHHESPQALPITRVVMAGTETMRDPGARRGEAATRRDRSLFSGDEANLRRADKFTGPVPTQDGAEQPGPTRAPE